MWESDVTSKLTCTLEKLSGYGGIQFERSFKLTIEITGDIHTLNNYEHMVKQRFLGFDGKYKPEGRGE